MGVVGTRDRAPVITVGSDAWMDSSRLVHPYGAAPQAAHRRLWPELASRLVSDVGVPVNTIVVVGEGAANVSADTAAVTVSLGTRASSPGEALTGVSESSRAVLAAAREQGVSDRDLKTRAITVVPQVDHPSRRVLGYVASYTLEVRLRALDEAPRIIDALVDTAGEALRLGGFRVQVAFELAD